jgi:hypothetical protein
VPPGFQAELFASDLKDPRALVVAPNGDVFVAESEPGRIRVLLASDSEAKPREAKIFASGLDSPFGMAFYPPGPGWKRHHLADFVPRRVSPRTPPFARAVESTQGTVKLVHAEHVDRRSL